MKVKIEVTAEDIEMGERRSCNSCPIALAIERRFPEARAVDIHHDRIRLYDLYGLRRKVLDFKPPASAIFFMTDFDNGHPVQPFAFEMEEAV